MITLSQSQQSRALYFDTPPSILIKVGNTPFPNTHTPLIHTHTRTHTLSLTPFLPLELHIQALFPRVRLPDQSPLRPLAPNIKSTLPS